MTTIDFISYPYCFTNDNQRLHVEEFAEEPRVNSSIEKRDGQWHVLSKNADPNCLNGVCDLKLPDNGGKHE